jgi:hypothetical protein
VAPWSGLMANYMRAGGKTANETGRGDRSIQTEISMMAIGRMISFMDMASSHIKMDTDMKENGKKTSSTVRELLPGLMAVVTRVVSYMGRCKDMVNIKTLMATPTRESSTRAYLKAKVLMMTPEKLSNRHLSV